MHIVLLLTATLLTPVVASAEVTYPVVDTNQRDCFDERSVIECPQPGSPFHGQDAQFSTNPPAYKDNGDGTVSDLVTGLMWTKDPGDERLSLRDASSGAPECRAGGHSDWRLPTIKELYSLIQFNGTDPDPRSFDNGSLVPFIDVAYFDFQYGDPDEGGRIIDAQYATSTKYVSTTMDGNETMFGVNFADGRIKGYPSKGRRGEGNYFVLYVRGNPAYGKNELKDNGDGTVTDEATGLIWAKADSGEGMNWKSALEYADHLELAGYSDWRLPTAKELQSIVDYSRSPDTHDSAAIDPTFEATPIKNEGGKQDFGWYWTSTTHQSARGGSAAIYVAFGRAVGFMKSRRSGDYRLLDVHGAGAQRSDPKRGDAADFPHGRGPQGDVIRIGNLVRCVRGGASQPARSGITTESTLTREVAETEPLSPVTTARQSKPNFVFILTDDMGWTGTSVEMIKGDPTTRSDFYQTPSIEKLAARGMRFSAAYSPAALCTPSRASILTGKTPAELHITSPGGGRGSDANKLIPARQLRELPESETTIAELLRQAGYATAHLGKWHLGQGDPGEHGFDLHDGSTANATPDSGEPDNPKDIFGLNERAIAFMIEQSSAGRPFYLQLSHYAVHSPVETLDKSKAKFDRLPEGERHDNAEYAGMTWDLDSSIGGLLDAIDELGISDSTYVVFMSDNGAGGNPRRPQNAPLNAGKGSLHEGGIRVPLIVSGPGITPDTSSDVSVTGADLFPTLCEWAGVSADEVDGTSLVPLLTGTPDRFQRADEVLLFHFPHYGQGPNQRPQSAIILGNYKLLKDYETETYQLFDLQKDIGETTNLADSMPGKVVELTLVMERRLEGVDAQIPTPNPDYNPDAKQETRKRKGRRNR